MRAGRLRSLARVWRPTEAVGRLKTAATTETDTGNDVWLEFVDPKPGLQDYGPGEQRQATTGARMRWPTSVLPRDVLAITEGPHAGERWRVEGLASPDNHEVAATLVAFNATLP